MILVIGISDKSARKRVSAAKKMARMSEKFEGSTVWVPDESIQQMTEIVAIRDVREVLRARGGINKEEISPIQGVYVPLERFEQFYLGLQKLALKYNIPAPLQGSALTSVFEIMAEFDFTKVSERQKSIRFLTELAELLAKVDGEFSYGAGEGRIFGGFIRGQLGKDIVKLYDEIKLAFDPHGILNIGVKADVDMKNLVKNLKNGR